MHALNFGQDEPALRYSAPMAPADCIWHQPKLFFFVTKSVDPPTEVLPCGVGGVVLGFSVAPIQVAAALRHLVQQRGLPVLVIHVWAGGPHRAVCSAPTAAPSSG